MNGISIFIVALANLAAAQVGTPLNNRSLSASDIVVVARFVADGGGYETKYLGTEESTYVRRYVFSPDLVISGSMQGDSFQALIEEPDSAQPCVYSKGRYYLLRLHLGDSSHTVRSFHGGDFRFRLESEAQLALGSTHDDPSLPELQFSLVGSTKVERCAWVLAKSFEATKDVQFVKYISDIRPAWRSVNGEWVVLNKEQDGPTFFTFYKETIEPILLRVSANDDLSTLHVLTCSVVIGREDRRSQLRSLIAKIDQETPDRDAKVPINLGIFAQEPDYLRQLFNSRLTSVKCAAIDAFEVRPERRDFVIHVLGDASERVRFHAIRWLYQLKEPRAPQPNWGANETVENEAEVIAYWRGR